MNREGQLKYFGVKRRDVEKGKTWTEKAGRCGEESAENKG
jgi:hypothetical protein